MLSSLCSYENMGTANTYLTPASAVAPPLQSQPWQRLDLQWPEKSSQQCFAVLGDLPPGPSRLWIQVTSNRAAASPQHVGNQVKLYGIFTQAKAERSL